MTGNNYGYFKSDLTGLYVIHNKKGNKTFSGISDEYNCKRIVNLLNKKDEQIKELEKEVKSKQRVIDAYEQYVKDLKEDGDVE